MPKREFSLFLSCEHASNAVPEFLAERFKSRKAQKVLETHRGYDIGAAEVFRELSRLLRPTFAIEGSYTRLSIDLNRNSLRNHRYSEFSEALPAEEKNLLEEYFETYRGAFFKALEGALQKRTSPPALHLSVHSFTPVLNGEVRNADLGILYDPARKKEAGLARLWKQRLQKLCPTLRVRFNYPYAGKTDGHTTALRKRFSESRYLGFEIEINQALFKTVKPQRIAEIFQQTLDV